MTTAKSTPPRLPLVETPDDPLAREQFAKLAAGRGILNLHRMMAYAPELMKASGDMAVAFRHEAILARALAEIVILRTAQVADCDYEWERHVPIARAAGVSEQQIAEVGRWPQSTLFNPKEKIALKYAEILTGGARSTIRRLPSCNGTCPRARLSRSPCWWAFTSRQQFSSKRWECPTTTPERRSCVLQRRSDLIERRGLGLQYVGDALDVVEPQNR